MSKATLAGDDGSMSNCAMLWMNILSSRDGRRARCCHQTCKWASHWTRPQNGTNANCNIDNSASSLNSESIIEHVKSLSRTKLTTGTMKAAIRTIARAFRQWSCYMRWGEADIVFEERFCCRKRTIISLPLQPSHTLRTHDCCAMTRIFTRFLVNVDRISSHTHAVCILALRISKFVCYQDSFDERRALGGPKVLLLKFVISPPAV